MDGHTQQEDVYSTFRRRPEDKPKLWTEAADRDSEKTLSKCGKAVHKRTRTDTKLVGHRRIRKSRRRRRRSRRKRKRRRRRKRGMRRKRRRRSSSRRRRGGGGGGEDGRGG